MEDTFFTQPEALDTDPRPTIGGKAAGLLRLHAADAPVPPWVVLPADRATAFNVDCPELRQELAALFAELSPHDEGIAVRSSGLVEDQSGASAAGIYETRFCASAAELPEAIESVLMSARGWRASSYNDGSARRDLGKPKENKDGTSAPAHPRPVPHSPQGRTDEANMAVILQRRIKPILSGVAFSAHPGRARYDRVLVEAVHGGCAALVDGAASPSRFELLVASGEPAAIEPGTDGPATLSAELAAALLFWLLKLEEIFDAALDIEWAADADGLWLLQARPITRLSLDPALRPPAPATSWFFDQRFHEPIHPITRTTLLPLILRTGVEEALRLRGMSAPEPHAFDFAGQVYVRLEAYHRLLRNLSGWLLTPDLRQLYPAGTHPGRLPGLGLIATGLPVLWRERRRVLCNIRTWDMFRDGLDARLAAIPMTEPGDAAGWCEPWARLDQLTVEFLRIHRWSIVLADYAYNAYLGVTRCLPAVIRARLRVHLRLVTAEANTARDALTANPTPAQRDTFIRRFGHRSASLDYATPVWAESLGGGAEAWGIDAARAIDTTPRGRGVLVRLLEMREEQRFHWERILARQRAMLLDAGRTLAAEGLLADPNDIWWLEWDELQCALADGIVPDAARIAGRRRTHRINAPAKRPAHIVPGDASQSTEAGADNVLRGSGAASGVARGTAIVCRRLQELPETIPPDTILVLPCLDPAWTPVLRQVAGLVIERGGLLSHAAIIAREYGLPLVIGVSDATERIRTGDRIEVDGDGGVVRLG